MSAYLALTSAIRAEVARLRDAAAVAREHAEWCQRRVREIHEHRVALEAQAVATGQVLLVRGMSAALAYANSSAPTRAPHYEAPRFALIEID